MAYIGVSPSNGTRRVHTYTATASQTTFSGAGAEGTTLSYKDSNFVDVYQNGVKLGDADYTATSGTSIVLDTEATVSDLVVIVVYDVFSVADTVSKADGGTFDGNVTMGGTLAVTGASTLTSALSAKGGAVFNEDSADVDFRVESNGNANMLFVDGGNDHVNIGSSSDAGGVLNVSDGTSFSTGITVENTGDTHGSVIDFLNNSASPADGDYIGGLIFKETNSAGGTHQFAKIFGIATDITDGTEDGEITFETSAGGANTAERCRISSTGVLMVGQTAFNPANVGTSLTSSGQLNGTASGDISLQLNRTSSNGQIAQFRQDNTTCGAIGAEGGDSLFIQGGTTSGCGLHFHISNASITPARNGARIDNQIDLGTSSHRFQTLFATTSSINTSDRNDKQDIEELTDAEKRVAIVAKGLLRKYRWKDAVAKKGDNARIHFGIIAQDLQDAFTAESLDASEYGMFCSNTWWEKEITVDAVQADEEKGIEAKDAYTYMDIKEEATEGYTIKTRLGVRYSELLAFIISAI